MSEAGHNSAIPGAELAQFVERLERLNAEKDGIASDIRDVYAELKGRGFDASAVRTIVKMRKEDADKRAEREAILELYMQALGMLFDTPLGNSAVNSGMKIGVPKQ
jgi:uncharacterized protein (UPF0335 family)